MGTESCLMEHGETIKLKEQNQRLITQPYTLLFLFNVYLYLSYNLLLSLYIKREDTICIFSLVTPMGFKPMTLGTGILRSIQLSYGAIGLAIHIWYAERVQRYCKVLN